MLAKFKGRGSSYDIDSSIFISALIIGSTLVSYLATIGFTVAHYNLFVFCGVGLSLVNFSLVYRIIADHPDRTGQDAMLTVLLFLFVLILSLTGSGVALVSGFVLALAGFCTVPFLLVLSKGNNLSKALIWLVFPILLIIWVTGVVHGNGIHHPLWLERLSMGWMHIDQLFHGTIAQMINTYGVSSTGIQGTPYFPYHFGSHVILGRLADLFDVHVLESYNVVFPIVIIPLYFRAVLFSAKDLSRVIFGASNNLASRGSFWLFFIVLVIGFLPNTLTHQHFAIWDGWLVSESYHFSLLFFFLSLSVGLLVVESHQSKGHLAFYSLVFVVVYACAAFSKISLAIVICPAVVYCVVRSGKWKSPIVVINLIAILLITYIVMKVTGEAGESSPFESTKPLHFVKTWSDPNWRALYVPVYYLFVVIYAAIRIRANQIDSVARLKEIIMARKLLDVEFLTVISVVGFLPAAIFIVPGGSAAYFVDIQTRIGLVFIVAWLLFRCTEDLRTETQAQSLNQFISKNSFIVLVAILICANNIYLKLEDILNKNLSLRGAVLQFDSTNTQFYGAYSDFYTYFEGDVKDTRQKIWEIAYHSGMAASKNSSYNYYKWLLDSCAQIPNKMDYYLAIPKSNTAFWQGAHYREDAIPFMMPALTGIAMSNGLPTNYKSLKNYGYLLYHDMTIDSVECTKIDNKNILVINPNDRTLNRCN